MVPGSFARSWRSLGTRDFPEGVVYPSVLCIGIVPATDSCWRVFFMRCHDDGRVEFYEDPSSWSARKTSLDVEPECKVPVACGTL